MLQVQVIRQNREEVIRRLRVKNFKNLELVDEVLSLDEDRKRLTQQYDEGRATLNRLSDQISTLFKAGQKALGEEKKGETTTVKQTLGEVTEALQVAEARLQESLVLLPNLPHASVPPGNTPGDNELVRDSGTLPVISGTPLPHWEIARIYQLIDFDLGARITGSGFPVYRDQGARLQWALIRFFLEFNRSRGYMEYMPPLLVNPATAFGTGQLPDKESQMYFVEGDQFYLIPTAELPLTNIYRDANLKAEELPIRMTAYSPCFRREAGSYGKDVKGLNRLHQFEKVEIVQITHPDQSYEALEGMVRHVEELIGLLGLPYRILRLCGGDMSFASALTYDFEVWSVGQQKWLEVSSVSNFETFQSNRMKIRFRDTDSRPRLVHTLNGSSLALPRIVASLLELNQGPEGIRIPGPLQPFFGNDRISPVP